MSTGWEGHGLTHNSNEGQEELQALGLGQELGENVPVRLVRQTQETQADLFCLL